MNEVPVEITAAPAGGGQSPPAESKPGKYARLGKALQVFIPNKVVSPTVMKLIVAFQVMLFLIVWSNSSFEVLPKPMEVMTAFRDLWTEFKLGREIMTSFEINIQALVATSVLGLGLSYLTVMPFFRPLALAVSKGRFLSLVGFSFILTLMVGGGHNLKLSLLIIGMTVFFVTSMASVVSDIPKDEFDYARTLRMSEWRVVWEVVILGTADKALEIMRQNAAIGWMMLTMVEGISRSEGGIGALLLNQQKHFHIAAVFAAQITVLLIGLGQDFFLGFVKRVACPYAGLTLERAS